MEDGIVEDKPGVSAPREVVARVLPQHRWEELVRGHGCRDESDAA
jgi:hypothetical protein